MHFHLFKKVQAMQTTKSTRSVSADLRVFVAIVLALVLIGCVFIYSASSVYSLERLGSAHYYLTRQVLGIILGLVSAVVIQYISLESIKKCVPYVYLASIGLTLCTFVPQLSRRVHGASRWLSFGGFAFQPSELLKVSLIVYLAYILCKKDWGHASFWRDFVPLMFIIGLPCALLLAQPDFGTAATLAGSSFILLFLASFSMRLLGLAMSAVVPLIFILALAKPYRFNRLLTFINPWHDPQGAGFQIIQSLIAIGSGSWFGVGIGNSRQKFFYLPMQHTDFIFSVIAEEVGLIGSSLVIILLLLLLHRGMRIAVNATDTFARYLTAGFTVLISLQSLFNIAVATGLVPTKGFGLPFVSYGNTGLVVDLFMVGLIVRAHRE